MVNGNQYGTVNPVERFWAKVAKGDSCWQWLGSPSKEGYGQFTVGHAYYLAHRFAYQLLVGDIPNGLQIDHLCRNRMCVNPDHMEPVTTRINLVRGETLAAANLQKTHCLRGHPFDLFNTYFRPDDRNERGCRKCLHEASQRWQQSSRQEVLR